VDEIRVRGLDVARRVVPKAGVEWLRIAEDQEY
jgi:hypothetical protein